MSRIVDWLEHHQMTCYWKKFLGFDCPGCGIQSAIIELLKGNLIESIRLYPGLIPLLLTLAFLLFHLVIKLRSGALILKFLFIFTSSIVLVSYIIKLFSQ
jgi:hypothetical protein